MSSNNENINPEFSDLFAFENEKEELKHDAQVLMFRFLSEIEKVNGGEIRQKEFAKAINTSRSFVNQLFSGDKLCNLITLAKLQKSFDVIFEVVATPAKQNAYQFVADKDTCLVRTGVFTKVSSQLPSLTFKLGGRNVMTDNEHFTPQITATA